MPANIIAKVAHVLSCLVCMLTNINVEQVNDRAIVRLKIQRPSIKVVGPL